MVDTHSTAEKMHLLEPNTKISMISKFQFEFQPIGLLSAVRWATNRSDKQRKFDIFYRMQRQLSDILNSNDTKTGDFERHLRLFNVRKLHRPRMWDAHRTLCLLCLLCFLS